MNITAQYGSYALNERRNHTRLGNSHPFLDLSRKSARTAQIEMLPPVAWPQLPPRTVGPAVPTELTGAGCGPQAAALLAFQPICLTSVKDHTQVSLHLCCLILPSRPPNNKAPLITNPHFADGESAVGLCSVSWAHLRACSPPSDVHPLRRKARAHLKKFKSVTGSPPIFQFDVTSTLVFISHFLSKLWLIFLSFPGHTSDIFMLAFIIALCGGS